MQTGFERKADEHTSFNFMRVFYTKSAQQRNLNAFHRRRVGVVLMIKALSMQHAVQHHVTMMRSHWLLLFAGFTGDDRRADDDVG